jgi:hypothetical protein
MSNGIGGHAFSSLYAPSQHASGLSRHEYRSSTLCKEKSVYPISSPLKTIFLPPNRSNFEEIEVLAEA